MWGESLYYFSKCEVGLDLTNQIDCLLRRQSDVHMFPIDVLFVV